MLVRILTLRWVQIILLLLLLGGAVALRSADPSFVKHLRNLVFDHYNRKLPRKPGNQTVIIDVDEESLRRIGQWPWPRSVAGDIPVILKEMGAKSVAFDMVFAEPDRTSPAAVAKTLPATEEMAGVRAALESLPDNDAIFARKIAEAGNVVLGFVGAADKTEGAPQLKASFISKGKKADMLPFVERVQAFAAPLPELGAAAAGAGSFSVTPGSDGVLRRVPLLIAGTGETAVYPALSLEALRVALGKQVYVVTSYGEVTREGHGISSVAVGDYAVPVDKRGALWVYYAGHRPELYIPAWKLLAREVDPALVRGKIAFVGTSAIGLLDLRSSPLDVVLPGVEVHAEMAEQILGGQFLRRPEFIEGAEMISVAAVCLLVIFLAPFIGTATLALLAAVLGAGGYFGGLYMYQNYGYLMDPLYPTLSIVFIFILSAILTNLRTEMEKRQIRLAFGQYISPVVLEELTSDPRKLKLGGEVRELSVMFTDIRNFTTISESMDPGELIRMMNDFLTPMTSAVLDNRGTIDKYMGDAMMTFWNAPVDDPHHAVNACKAALEMVAALGPVNEELKLRAEAASRPFHELKAGIGIHSGRASVGNMGSKQRFAYSALGDTVNLASRLEGQTKAYGVSILFSGETRRQAQGFAAIEVDLLTVKGRTEPERTYALLGPPEEAQGAAFRDFAEKHAEMLAAYRAMKWGEAWQLAAQLAEERPALAALYRLYQSRIAAYRENPPPAGWNGVWVAKEK